MPTWGAIHDEAQASRSPSGGPDVDGVRRKYLARLAALTGRPVIVYATSWLDKESPSNLVQIELGDLQGFMNAVAGLPGRQLDLLITSPGGDPAAAESIVSYLRTQFDHIRVLVPVAAMSAATMVALGADEIVMGAHSQLGPIDPQFVILTPEGPRAAPAQAILDQFEQAKKDCQDPANLAAWMPIIRGYSPGLLAQCVHQRQLAERMVRDWLEKYMLRADPNGPAKAAAAASWFADYQRFQSHSRRVSFDDVQALGLKVSALETDNELQDAVLSVHHAFAVTFSMMPAVKIVENHLGKAYVKVLQDFILPVRAPEPAPSTSPPSLPGRPPSRAQRRSDRFGRK